MNLEGKYMKYSLTILNDSFLYKKSIRTSYDVLAAASIFVSITIVCKMENIDNFNNEKWWSKYYNINEEELLETITWITAIQKHFKPFLEAGEIKNKNMEFDSE